MFIGGVGFRKKNGRLVSSRHYMLQMSYASFKQSLARAWSSRERFKVTDQSTQRKHEYEQKLRSISNLFSYIAYKHTGRTTFEKLENIDPETARSGVPHFFPQLSMPRLD
jgi:hypothetical protein